MREKEIHINKCDTYKYWCGICYCLQLIEVDLDAYFDTRPDSLMVIKGKSEGVKS